MHYVGHFDSAALAAHPILDGHSHGYVSASLVDHTSGSVHTGLSMSELAPDGILLPHVHSHEESFYILAGQATVRIHDDTYGLGPGDYGVCKVGTVHAWRNTGTTPVRWLQTAAPQPKPIAQERDTFFLKDGQAPQRGDPLDLNDCSGALLGHFDASQITDEERIATGGLQGVFLKWLIDEKLGAIHHRLLFIEYQPTVGIGLHDHGYEEAYLILTGEVEAILDGTRYVALAGDVLWTGAGCVHAFKNVGSEPVRWLETFSPQPPSENVFRFMAEWEQKAKELEG